MSERDRLFLLHLVKALIAVADDRPMRDGQRDYHLAQAEEMVPEDWLREITRTP